MPILLQSTLLLSASNVFMTIAWYGHLKNLAERPWWIAAFVSWGIALFEYLLQVLANRIGHSAYNVAHLKILQEVITLGVFVPFTVLYLDQPVKSRLPLGRPVPVRCRVFHLPQLTAHRHGCGEGWRRRTICARTAFSLIFASVSSLTGGFVSSRRMASDARYMGPRCSRVADCVTAPADRALAPNRSSPAA